MAYGDPYVTLELFRTRLGIKSDAEDAFLTMALAGACEAIDAYCGQQFNRGPDAEIRYLTPIDSDVLEIDTGIVSLSGFTTDDDGAFTYANVWPGSAYVLHPIHRKPGRPFTEIRRVYGSGYVWRRWDRSIQLTGVFGWAAVPGAVQSAAMILGKRHYERWAAPFGLAGSGELGSQFTAIPGVDRDVRQILSGFRTLPAIG